jgi:hypothetical protein
MLELDMEIKCKNNPYYFSVPYNIGTTHFRGIERAHKIVERPYAEKLVGLCVDRLEKRPIATEKAIGLFSFVTKAKDTVVNYAKSYCKNIKHTTEHKNIYSIVEKELYGENSINSVTHDLDKLVLYTLGFPKSFVSDFHRKHSTHHPESGKELNVKSMVCDFVASSPAFKPEKKKSVRDYFNSSEELQKIPNLKEELEKCNYGESLDFNNIKLKKHLNEDYLSNQVQNISKAIACFFLQFMQ